MGFNNFFKFKIFIFIIISKQELAEPATNYLSDKAVSTNEASQQSFYPEISQAYFVPYQKYIPTSSNKYIVSQPENQIPIAEIQSNSTEKTVLSLESLDTSKYIASQLIKPIKDNQISYPYLYTLAKTVPVTAATYSLSPSKTDDYHTEVPKKYQYGYRVSNPHTGAEFGHSEVNDGVSARGYYHVLLPDGRLQNVKYWAGPSGYHATITYETQH